MSDSPAFYADARSNPLTGCFRSLPCWERCWARRFATRHAGRFGYDATDPFQPTIHEERMGEWKRWRKPKTIALCFMGDAFVRVGDGRWEMALGRMLGHVSEAPQHRFLLLTKRPALAREWVKRTSFYPGGDRSQRPVLGFPSNLYLGVSVEDQRSADERIPILLDTPAAHRWVSIEPQVGPVDLRHILDHDDFLHPTVCDFGVDPRRLHWVVQGCESGPHRRPFDVAWARSVRDQCKDAGVPFFLKQVQAPRLCDDGECSHEAGGCHDYDRCAGVVIKHPLLDGLRHEALPWEVTP